MENTLKRVQTITIGGIEREVEFLFIHRLPIIRWFSLYVHQAYQAFQKKHGRPPDDSDAFTVPNEFFFKSTWLILKKRGVWPFRKPFRSMRHMIRSIRADEYQAVVDFIARVTLEYKAKVNEVSSRTSAHETMEDDTKPQQ